MKKIFFVLAPAVGLFSALPALAVNINMNLPGTSPNTSIGGLIANIYNFAMIAAGILAFGAIVYGGIRYATGRGNPSEESDAKGRIWNALLGILLLAGAYIILYTINPNIVNLSLPDINQTVTASQTSTTPAPTPGCGVCNGNCNGTCSAGKACTYTTSGYSCQAAPTCGACGGTCNGTCPTGQTCAGSYNYGGFTCQSPTGCTGPCSSGCNGICPTGQTCAYATNGYFCQAVQATGCGVCGGTCHGTCPAGKTCQGSMGGGLSCQ